MAPLPLTLVIVIFGSSVISTVFMGVTRMIAPPTMSASYRFPRLSDTMSSSVNTEPGLIISNLVTTRGSTSSTG